VDTRHFGSARHTFAEHRVDEAQRGRGALQAPDGEGAVEPGRGLDGGAQTLRDARDALALGRQQRLGIGLAAREEQQLLATVPLGARAPRP
jgi:hypothetical protein